MNNQTFNMRPNSGVSQHLVVCLACLLSFACSSILAEEHHEEPVIFECDIARIGGTLTLPDHYHGEVGEKTLGKIPCVVIVGGSLSHTQDGGFMRSGAPKRDALKRLAYALAKEGYASLRYDKVGFGKSEPKGDWNGTYENEALVTTAAIKYVRKLDFIDHVAAIGESAGAYLLCLAAKAGTEVDAYIFFGGHCDSGKAIYEYNFGRLVEYAESSSERLKWAQRELSREMALGRSYEQMFKAAAEGKGEFLLVEGQTSWTVRLARRKEEIDMPPDEMFRYIRKPALALSGSCDLNVPPDHAARIVTVLRNAGNHSCTCITLPGLDHNFQISPEDKELRFRERYTFDSFKRPYDKRVYEEAIAWLDSTFAQRSPSHTGSKSHPQRAVEHPENESKSEYKPAKLYMAPGIQIIRNITDNEQITGVETLEGTIGPLLLGEDCQAHFIDMPPGMYCDEHPHSSESIIYTVSGKWVLCSAGRRQLMQRGSLFHFAPNTPTGYEVPFDKSALILIFKGKRLTESEREFVEYLRSLAKRLQQEQSAGIHFRLTSLPSNHPAIQFAKKVNPNFRK